jgi:hypothetical protein
VGRWSWSQRSGVAVCGWIKTFAALLIKTLARGSSQERRVGAWSSETSCARWCEYMSLLVCACWCEHGRWCAREVVGVGASAAGGACVAQVGRVAQVGHVVQVGHGAKLWSDSGGKARGGGPELHSSSDVGGSQGCPSGVGARVQELKARTLWHKVICWPSVFQTFGAACVVRG